MSLIRRILDAVVQRWWFLLFFLLLQLLPPYSSQGYPLRDWGLVNAYILTHTIKTPFAALYPVFQIIPLILIGMLFIMPGKAAVRIFSAYVAFSYAIIAFVQSVSISDRYGFSVCAASLITFLGLAGVWLWESIHSKKELFFRQKPPAWKYGLLLLALLPFWGPVNRITLLPDFNPVYLLTSGAGLSFCLVTPLYLAGLILFYPKLNRPGLVATSFVGVLMGLGNMVLEFAIYPAMWWIGVLHLPLLGISAICFALSFHEIVVQVRVREGQGRI